MRSIFVALSFLLAAGIAAAAETPLPKDVTLVNAFGKVSAEWALPSGHGQDCRLVIDPGGTPWLGCKGQFLEGPSHAVLYMTDRPFQGLVWLSGGTLLGISGDQVGVFSIAEAAKGGHGTARVPFQPLGAFPGKKLAIYGGSGNNAYVVVSDDKKSEVLLLWQKKTEWAVKNLFPTKFPVTAVGGDGIRTFVAVGRRVIGLGARPDADNHLALDAQILFDHPKTDVTALNYSPKLGLFYGTSNGAGYLGVKYNLEFLKAPGAKIQLAGDGLYLLPSSGGVLKVTGLDTFIDHDAAMAAAEAQNPELNGKK